MTVNRVLINSPSTLKKFSRKCYLANILKAMKKFAKNETDLFYADIVTCNDPYLIHKSYKIPLLRYFLILTLFLEIHLG